MRHFIGASVKTSTSKQDNRIYISNKKETWTPWLFIPKRIIPTSGRRGQVSAYFCC
jgi:hypothetical protein